MTPVRGIWLDVLRWLREYPGPLLAPAALLGAAADLIHLVEGDLLATIAVGLALAVAFELYVAYVELLMVESASRPGVAVTKLLRQAAPLVPALLAASVLGVSVPLAATGLLVVPGAWLLTRWSLFAPVIAREGLPPLDAIARSNALVRGRFGFVFAAVTLPLLLEHGVIHATALTAEPALGSQWLALIGSAAAVALVSPPVALAISLTYERLSPVSPSLAGTAGSP